MKLSPHTVITHAPHLQPPPPAPPAAAIVYVEPEVTFGLGDVFAVIAQPIARAVDKLTGSKLATCTPCSRRHSRLNRLVPDVKKPFQNMIRRK